MDSRTTYARGFLVIFPAVVQLFPMTDKADTRMDDFEIIPEPSASSCLVSPGQKCRCADEFLKLLQSDSGICSELRHTGSEQPVSMWRDFTLPEIAAYAHRLGMTWSCFSPKDRLMTAWGNGYFMTCQPGADGLYLHCTQIGLQSGTELCIPTKNADKLGFGILVGDPELGLPEFKVGTIEDVLKTMSLLDPAGLSTKKIMDIRNCLKWDVTLGFSDLIPLAVPILRRRGTSINRVRMPTRYCTGLLCHQVGFTAFREGLAAYVRQTKEPSNQAVKVLNWYKILARLYKEWENEALANSQPNHLSLAFLDTVHDCWEETRSYFIQLTKNNQGFRYIDLVACHIAHAVWYCDDAFQAIKGGRARSGNWVEEGAYFYLDYLPSIISAMQSKGLDKQKVRDAWYTMTLKGFCWSRLHHLYKGEKNPEEPPVILPSEYWDSEVRVQIGLH